MRVMIVSHARRFVFFPDPLGVAAPLVRGLAPFGDPALVAEEEQVTDQPFFQGMSPIEAEWACDGLEIDLRGYLRVAVVENPFVRMVRLYEKIAAEDPIWQAREIAGFGRRDFANWLHGTRPDGFGAAGRNGPRWRKFGAWSARHWCGAHINHVIRLEAIEEDLTPMLGALGVAPAFDPGFARVPGVENWASYYNSHAIDLITERYGWDLAQYGYGHAIRRAS